MMHDDIRLALTRLHQANKAPTLALLKSRLPRPFPMPELIAALNEWKRDPRPLDADPLAPPCEPDCPPDTPSLGALQAEIQQLKAQLAAVTGRLDALEKRN